MDARALNWRHVVPDEARPLLLLPMGEERVPGAVIPPRESGAVLAAVRAGPYPSVAVPDISSWADLHPDGISGMLASIVAAVAPGGWLYLGFTNASSPVRSRGSVGLTLHRTRRELRRARVCEIAAYLPFPDQRCPAFLVSCARPAGLAYFLRHLAFPFTGNDGNLDRRRKALLRVARRCALLAPHRLRIRFAPAIAIVARRPA